MRVTQISICNVYGDRNLFCYVFGLTHTRLTLIKATKAVAAMQRLFCVCLNILDAQLAGAWAQTRLVF